MTALGRRAPSRPVMVSGQSPTAPRPPRPAVAIMAKLPVPGHVKTRLARTLGATAACKLYEAFIADLDARLAEERLAALWFYTPNAPGQLSHLVPHAAGVLPQRGPDLGRRMEAALDDAFARGYWPVVLLGADVPHVPLQRVRHALDRLALGMEVVIGPAADGGYYLLALGTRAPELFREVHWGGPGVYQETMTRIRGGNLAVEELAPWFDIDVPEDLEKLRALLAAPDGPRLPRTLSALQALRGGSA